jgi:hypothetical protein
VGNHCLGAGCKAGSLFVTHVHEFYFAASNGIGNIVQRIAGNPPAMLDPCGLQRLDDYVSYPHPRHGFHPEV